MNKLKHAARKRYYLEVTGDKVFGQQSSSGAPKRTGLEKKLLRRYRSQSHADRINGRLSGANEQQLGLVGSIGAVLGLSRYFRRKQ